MKSRNASSINFPTGRNMSDQRQLLARLPERDSDQLGAIYDWPSVECLLQSPYLWLRLTGESERLDLAVARLRSATIFQIDSQGQIVPLGRRVPEAQCPEGDWQPLSSQVQLQLPPTDYAPIAPVSLPLTIQASSQPREINLVWSTLDNLQTAITNNFRNRFETLEFATAESGHVLVRGPHCALVDGIWFHLTDRVAVQAGYRIFPNVAAAELATSLELEMDQILLLLGDDRRISCRRLEFVQVQRSALFQTRERFSNE